MTRLRQVALVASELGPVSERLREELGLPDPYHDPGVGEFGLENAVFAVGDTFLEVVAPVRDDTTAGRYLDKRGGDGGYMAIFQVPDIAAARRRISEAGVRVVWKADLADIAGTHLHPKDVPGAIVSIDWASPPESWRWAGPAWTGTAPAHRPGGIAALTVQAGDPFPMASAWASVLGKTVLADGPAATVNLGAGAANGVSPPASGRESPDGAQLLRFVPIGDDRGEGISEITLAVPRRARGGRDSIDIGGVRLRLLPAHEEDQ